MRHARPHEQLKPLEVENNESHVLDIYIIGMLTNLCLVSMQIVLALKTTAITESRQVIASRHQRHWRLGPTTREWI
jgi:hypothetical protein